MIVKSLSRKSNSGQLLKYIFRYMLDEEKVKAHIEKVNLGRSNFLIRHNVRSRTVKGFIREFEENESFRLVHRSDSVKVFHTILSFSNKDTQHINDKLLKDIAKKFIEERGVNNLYVGTKHQDRNHIHLHIAVSGTQLNGRSSRMSKPQFAHLKLELDKYQQRKYPQLIHSLPDHGRSKKQKDKETILETVKQNRQTRKETLCTVLKDTFEKSSSKEQFLSELAAQGHEPYYRNGRLQGVWYEGEKFRFSRLGYDEANWQSFSQPQDQLQVQVQENIQAQQLVQENIQERLQESSALQELEQLRARAELEQERFIETEASQPTLPSNPQEQEMLNELSLLRNREQERGRSLEMME